MAALDVAMGILLLYLQENIYIVKEKLARVREPVTVSSKECLSMRDHTEFLYIQCHTHQLNDQVG